MSRATIRAEGSGPRPVSGPVRWAGTVLLVAAALPLAARPGIAQEVLPTLPEGTAVALLPIQSVQPTPGGAWPGGQGSRAETREALDAELQFAVSESPRSSAWLGPRDAVRRAARNPTLRLDPRHLAHRPLLVEKVPKRLPDPLHGQLRTMTAILNSRLAIVPLELRYEPAEEEPAAAAIETGAEVEDTTAEVEDTTAAAEDTSAAVEDASAGRGARPETLGRGVLRVALIDSRASRVLWRGEIQGRLVPSHSPGLLADLAARVVAAFAGS